MLIMHDEYTIVWLKIDGGTIAESPRRDSQTQKTARRTPEPTKRPIIVEEPQAYVEPPHWRASKSIMQVGAKKQNPIGSRRLMA